MTQQEFLKYLTKIMKSYGFHRKGNHFYFDFENDIMGVLGLQKSVYGPYYYIEYGYAFLSINPRAPFPKMGSLNVNLGRIIFNFEKKRSNMVEYEELDEKGFESTFEELFPPFFEAGRKGRDAIVNSYLDKVCFIVGPSTLQYLGIPKGNLTVLPELLPK